MNKRLSIGAALKLYRNALNYPLYLPPLGFAAGDYLVEGHLTKFHSELRRLADAGSRPAKALIGYFHVRGVFKGEPRYDLAVSHVLDAAIGGDAFSQYVLAWAHFRSGREVEAAKWMARSAFGGQFLPAVVDIAVWMASGRGFQDADAKAAMKIFWLATKNGHRTAVLYVSQLFLRGRFGIAAQLAIVLWFPFLLIWGIAVTALYPFSERSFWTPTNPRMRLFKTSIDDEQQA